MHDPVLDRPLFQTPGQREGSGIMAGVAPVNMANGGFLERVGKTGDLALDLLTEDPGSMVSDDFFSMEGGTKYTPWPERTEEGSGMNLRDITDLVFDPSDKFDVLTLPLIAFPPAFAAAKLIKYGLKGAKLAKQLEKIGTAQKLQKVAGIQEKMPFPLPRGTSRAKTWGQLAVGRELPEAPALINELSEGIQEFHELANLPEEEWDVEEGFADGGIASFAKGKQAVKKKIAQTPAELAKKLKAKRRREAKAKQKAAEQAEADAKKAAAQADKAAKEAAKVAKPPTPPKPAKPKSKKPAEKKVDKKERPTRSAAEEPITEGAKPSRLRKWGGRLAIPATIAGATYWLGRDKGDDEATVAPVLEDPEKLSALQQRNAIVTTGIDKFLKEQAAKTAAEPTPAKKWWEKGILGGVDRVLSGIDPRTGAGLIAGGSATEGFTPTNWAQRYQAGVRAYDEEQRKAAESAATVAGAQPAIKQQYDLLRGSAEPEAIMIDPFSKELLDEARWETDREVDFRVWKQLFERQEQAGKLEMMLEMFETLGVANVTKAQIEELLQDTVKTEEFLSGVFGSTPTAAAP